MVLNSFASTSGKFYEVVAARQLHFFVKCSGAVRKTNLVTSRDRKSKRMRSARMFANMAIRRP